MSSISGVSSGSYLTRSQYYTAMDTNSDGSLSSTEWAAASTGSESPTGF